MVINFKIIKKSRCKAPGFFYLLKHFLQKFEITLTLLPALLHPEGGKSVPVPFQDPTETDRLSLRFHQSVQTVHSLQKNRSPVPILILFQPLRYR